MKKIFIFIALGLFIGIMQVDHVWANSIQKKYTEALKIKGTIFQLEIARTPAAIQKGLMFRKSLEDHEGMLFIFPKITKASFWMKNTFVSLDVIFIDKEGKIIKIYSNAEPLSLKSLPCPYPAKAALEVIAGTAQKLKLQLGDHVNHDIFGSGK